MHTKTSNRISIFQRKNARKAYMGITYYKTPDDPVLGHKSFIEFDSNHQHSSTLNSQIDATNKSMKPGLTKGFALTTSDLLAEPF